jgi:single-stranded DNA-binding protein
MQVFGNIATPLEAKVSKAGNTYYAFRLAENNGKEENRSTTWYEGRAFISELDADLLSKGQFVKVTGKLEISAYMKKDGTPGASAVILAYKVEPIERKAKDSAEG